MNIFDDEENLFRDENGSVIVPYFIWTQLKEKTDKMLKDTKKIKKDAKSVVSTTWRFIGAYKEENEVPIKPALQQLEYHLKKIDYIFDGD